MSTATVPQLWNKSFILCLANNLFLFIFYFAQTTILPIYILNELHGTLAQAGLAMTLFMASAIAVRPFSGLIVEKIGVKKALYISEALFCLFCLTYMLADNLTLLLCIRFLHGIWFSILTTVIVPIVNDFIPAERKGEGMGYFLTSINLGIVLGPLIGLSLIQALPYITISAILAAFVLLGFMFCFMIPLKHKVSPVEKPEKRKLSLQDFIEKKAVPVSIMAMMVSFAYASIMSFISTFAESKHMLSYASLFFVVFAISMMILRPITGKIFDRKGANYVVYPALALFALGLLVLSQIDSVPGFMFAAVLIGMGFGSAQPCLQTISIQRSEKHRIGHATSTYFTCYDIGIALGSLILGIVIAHFDYSIAYMLCAGMIILSLLFYNLVVDKPAVTD
ncbi:MFS transporter [Acinetobacter sp. ANC 4169]|uniref:MFS transporter n=1 Tax=Acinetobacter sp. ANC 4169 TaxID=1977879 RepID=UPI000A3318CC|nr:MFS transporter [Acinetobacter sp. ANC 4169]OTG76655.1 MFS transporter [Acinetobacter sp. ANC 4169]